MTCTVCEEKEKSIIAGHQYQTQLASHLLHTLHKTEWGGEVVLFPRCRFFTLLLPCKYSCLQDSGTSAPCLKNSCKRFRNEELRDSGKDGQKCTVNY